MLVCCNCRFVGSYYHVLSNRPDFYRRIEFGICPNCGEYRLLDFRIVVGEKKIKTLSGKKAENLFNKIVDKLKGCRHGSKSNQNYHFGDYKLTKNKDSNGNPIYLQLMKNFNDEVEVLGEVQMKVYKIL